MYIKFCFILVITLSILIPDYVFGICSNTWRKKVGKIFCTDIDQDGYLTNLFEIRTDLVDIIEDKNITKLSINIANSYFPIIDEWIYLPWDDLLAAINTLKMTNCSVNSIKSLYRFPSLETLDLSGNNITDFNFLSKLKKLKYLHLRHSTFSKDNFLFTHLQRYQNRLKFIDLSYDNLVEFHLLNNIEKYDLSENSNLTLITFNQSFPIKYLNLSGNTQLKSFKNVGKTDFLCVSSINLSYLNKSLTNSLLENIKISDEIFLNNNNIKNLNDSIFPLVNLLSKKCSAGPGISVDLSNCNLEHISSTYFNSYTLSLINLSHNNLCNLEGFIFSRSEIFVLDLSDSNISMIDKNVFSYATITLLNLSKNNISSLEEVFDYIESVRELDLSFNPIQTLSRNTFKNCQDLEVVNLAGTSVILSENTFSSLLSLRKLTLSLQDKINISLIQNMYVTDLTICDSLLSKLGPENFKGFYKLSTLNFLNSSISNVSSLSFKGLSMLKTLNIKGLNGSNRNIDIFKYLPNLQDLDLSKHSIKNIGLEFEGMHSLNNLNLSSNIIAEIAVGAFASLKKLKVLSLASNQLSTIALGTFAHLQKLTHLYLSHNSLQKLHPGIFSGLDSLILLDISKNQLLRTKPHVLVSNTLTILKYLYLQGNKLGNEYATNDNTLRKYEFDIIANQGALVYIDINDNEWSCSTLLDVLTNFRNNNVTYRPTNPVYTQSNVNGISCIP